MTPRVDWERRDAELAGQLRHAARQLLMQEPPVRASRTRMAREVRKQGIPRKNLDKLPKCARVFAEFSETSEAFAARMSSRGMPNDSRPGYRN